MNSELRWRLSIMMFLQYATWGAWSPVLSAYLEKMGFSGFQSSIIYSMLPVGCMIAPFIGGQLADRYFATNRLLVVFHLAGGVLLCVMAPITSFDSMWLVMLGWSLVYAPTLALTNSITFQHLPDAETRFGLVRVWGTIGWIAAGLLLTGLRQLQPAGGGFFGLPGDDSLWLSGVFSIALGLFCVALPSTPPAKTGASPWAFLGAIKLLRNPSFALFIAIAFIVATELMFYYVLTAPFLQSIGVSNASTPLVMTIAQVAEIGVMLALPWMLNRWGVRKTMAIGIAAWPLRYLVFAAAQPLWLVIAALTLHGLCYVCFFVVAYIYVNSAATPDIRASAQALITFVVLGAGMFCGSIFAGWLKDSFTTGGVVNYTNVFLVPAALTILCAILFFVGFKEKKQAWQQGYRAQEG